MMKDSSTYSENDVLDLANQDFEETLSTLREFISLKSISTDPYYSSSCQQTADWCAQYLKQCGFSAQLCQTEGNPIVVAHSQKSINKPKVLFYGHYDVQPPDPLELWHSDPFVMEIRDEQIFARGASDDKGQIITFLEAFRFWYDLYGYHPINGIILLEGEEEIGSTSLKTFLTDYRDTLKSDFACICDTPQIDKESPAIVTSLRGLATAELIVSTGLIDLHSGMYGGTANNAINILCDVLGALFNVDGSIAVPGFYEDVQPIPDTKIKKWVESGYFQGNFCNVLELDSIQKDDIAKIAKSVWGSPTIDINGIQGGYNGPGSKTIIPAEASAKISMRLVPNQDPSKLLNNLELFARERAPKNVKIELQQKIGSPATTFNVDSIFFEAVKHALSREWRKQPSYIGCGGSIPVAEMFKSVLGIDTALVGFGLDHDRVHSPNEKYELSSLRHGTRSWIRILGEFGKLEKHI